MATKKKSWFYTGHFGFIKFRLNEFKDYVLAIESNFQEKKGELRRRYKEEIKKIEKKSEEEFHISDYYEGELITIDRVYLETFRYSAIVSIYSILESSLNALCKQLKKTNNLSLDLGEIHGEGIERARLYLQKVCHVKFPARTDSWSNIQKLNKIRNCIVHAEGDVERTLSSTKVKNIVKNTKGLSLMSNYIKVDKKYIEDIIRDIDDFLETLYENV